MNTAHQAQKDSWNKEHKQPFAVQQMDATHASGSVELFYEFLQKEGSKNLKGLEMGCGKGRNVLWLANQPGIGMMSGFDFSEVAIAEAKKRGKDSHAEFKVMDATEPWKYEADTFDFGIDCTASTDIEDPIGRKFAAGEFFRVLKTGGALLVYAMSTDDEYHKKIINESPAPEPHAFLHPQTGKFEKVFTAEELDSLYGKLKLIEGRRIEKETEFFGKKFQCKNHWRIYKK